MFPKFLSKVFNIDGLNTMASNGKISDNDTVVFNNKQSTSSVLQYLVKFSDLKTLILSNISNLSLGSITLTKANVTQATSETTAVTANGGAGVITGFSSITAAGGSYTFTFNNSSIKTTSVIELTEQNLGNGIPKAVLTNISNGSCTITVFNIHTTAAFNNSILLHYNIL